MTAQLMIKDVVTHTAVLTRDDMLRVKLLLNDSTPDTDEWLTTEYTQDIHLLFHLYVTVRSITNDSIAAVAAVRIMSPDDATRIQRVKEIHQQSLMLIGDNRYIIYAAAANLWLDTWRDIYVQQPRLLITTAINLYELISRPLP